MRFNYLNRMSEMIEHSLISGETQQRIKTEGAVPGKIDVKARRRSLENGLRMRKLKEELEDY